MATGFACTLLLPTAAAWMLRSAEAVGQLTKVPVDLSSRADAFFLSVFGGWGLIVYIWSCRAFSASKGRAAAWGWLGLPAVSSFICLAWFGNPAFGLLALLGAGGFVVPSLLPADRVLLALSTDAAGSASALNMVRRLARETTWVWALGLFAGASLAYGNSFHGGMTLDNKYIIEEYFHTLPKINPAIDLYSWPTMVPLFFQNDYWWPKGISGLYRPIAVLSYWMNYAINHAMGNDPLDPFQYHVVNFFLHWFAACLGFVLIRQLSGRRSLAFFTALLFVTHPIATESVSNIIGRSDILAAITVFGCLVLYIRGTRDAAERGDTGSVARTWRIGPWILLFSVMELVVGVSIAVSGWLETPRWLQYTQVFAAVVVPVTAFFVITAARRNQWTRFPWLAAMMGVLAIGLFSKESAIAVAALIVVYDCIYRWTIEDLRAAVPSLLALSLLSAALAVVCLWIGQFGALGLSEGLTPVLVILLLGSLIVSAGLVLAWVFWVLSEPISLRHLIAPWQKYFLAYATVIPPIILWLGARRWVFANASPPETPYLDNPIRGLGFFAARMTASDVFLRLTSLLAWPARLSCDYSFNQIPLFYGHLGSAETWLALAGALILASIIALIALTYRKHKLICFLLVFYLLAYLPTSNFLIIIGSIMAERFLYLPLLAFAAFIVLGVEALIDWLTREREIQSGSPSLRSVVAYTVLAAIGLAYSVRARFRNDDWLSDITLWTSAAEMSPQSFRSYQSKAFALYERYVARAKSGVYDSDPALRAQDIDACFETAEKAKPIVDSLSPAENSSRLYLHLGMYYSEKGQTVGHFQQNGVLVPGDPAQVWYRKAERVLQQGVVIDRTFDGINRKKEEQRKLKTDAEIPDVGLPPIYSALGNVYARLGEWPKAVRAFEYMRHLEPVDADAYVGLATCYAGENRAEAESIALLQALLLDGKRTELWSALAHSLAAVNNSGTPALTSGPGGKLQIHIEIPEVRSILCSAYQGLVRTFLLAKRPQIAHEFRRAAMTEWNFSGDLFDGLVSDVDAEAPVPPEPD
jgi:tetratricopeptide (TPR) repeat protein